MRIFRKNLLRKAFIAGIYALGVYGILASGGGGGDSDGTAPVISNLVFSPDSVYENEGGGQVNITGTVDFTDQDGDVISATVTIFDSIGQEVSSESIAIANVEGLTSGTIQGSFIGGTTVVDTFEVRVYLTDASNLRSNILASNFRVSQFPWVAKTPMPSRRSGSATTTLNGLIYVIGGVDDNAPGFPKPPVATVEIYNPSTDSWSSGPELLVALSGQMAATANGKIYAIGGKDSLQTDVVQEFDPVAMSWSFKSNMPDQRSNAAVATHNDIIYIAGGSGIGLTQYASLLFYDPVADSWSAGSPMSQRRVGPAGDIIDGKFYVYGGYDSLHVPDGGYLRSLESYDPLMDTWNLKSSGEPRRDFGSGLVDEFFYAIGGNNVARSLDLVTAYDYLTDQWTLKTPLPKRLALVQAEVIGDKIYVFEMDNTFEYTPSNDIR